MKIYVAIQITGEYEELETKNIYVGDYYDNAVVICNNDKIKDARHTIEVWENCELIETYIEKIVKVFERA